MVGYGAREVTFESGGSTIAAVFYRPNRPGRHPCVVMAHGFSGTMDWILPDFAAVFAAAGFAVLTFDYRHFGASEGQPRQLVDSQRLVGDRLGELTAELRTLQSQSFPPDAKSGDRVTALAARQRTFQAGAALPAPEDEVAVVALETGKSV